MNKENEKRKQTKLINDYNAQKKNLSYNFDTIELLTVLNAVIIWCSP